MPSVNEIRDMVARAKAQEKELGIRHRKRSALSQLAYDGAQALIRSEYDKTRADIEAFLDQETIDAGTRERAWSKAGDLYARYHETRGDRAVGLRTWGEIMRTLRLRKRRGDGMYYAGVALRQR